MPFIHWTDSLSVGIESIDEQHKLLVEIINNLDDAMRESETDQIISEIFQRMIGYTEMHFAFEENLFDSHGYQGSSAHKEQHVALIETIQALKHKLDEGDARVGIEVMEFLKRWLTDHILKTDKDYAEFLVEKGVK
jgi:hemerythrin-like metal-binding protein